MRERSVRIAWGVAAAALGLVVAAASPSRGAPRTGSTITVRVMTAKIMKQPRFIGGVAKTVSRGEHLAFQDAQGDWYRVTAPSGEAGWIHQSNVVESSVQLSQKPGVTGAQPTKEEVELAGRGFTPQVEQEYRQKHRDLDFSHVDRIERLQSDPERLGAFAASGRVGGAP